MITQTAQESTIIEGKGTTPSDFLDLVRTLEEIHDPSFHFVFEPYEMSLLPRNYANEEGHHAYREACKERGIIPNSSLEFANELADYPNNKSIVLKGFYGMISDDSSEDIFHQLLSGGKIAKISIDLNNWKRFENFRERNLDNILNRGYVFREGRIDFGYFSYASKNVDFSRGHHLTAILGVAYEPDNIRIRNWFER